MIGLKFRCHSNESWSISCKVRQQKGGGEKNGGFLAEQLAGGKRGDPPTLWRTQSARDRAQLNTAASLHVSTEYSVFCHFGLLSVVTSQVVRGPCCFPPVFSFFSFSSFLSLAHFSKNLNLMKDNSKKPSQKPKIRSKNKKKLCRTRSTGP